jgi:hypothetical protein
LRAARPMVWISEVSLRKKAFLVGVEDRDQRAFGNVEALAQQVDADQRVERAEAKIRMISMRSMVSISSACSGRECPARADIR